MFTRLVHAGPLCRLLYVATVRQSDSKCNVLSISCCIFVAACCYSRQHYITTHLNKSRRHRPCRRGGEPGRDAEFADQPAGCHGGEGGGGGLERVGPLHKYPDRPLRNLGQHTHCLQMFHRKIRPRPGRKHVVGRRCTSADIASRASRLRVSLPPSVAGSWKYA